MNEYNPVNQRVQNAEMATETNKLDLLSLVKRRWRGNEKHRVADGSLSG